MYPPKIYIYYEATVSLIWLKLNNECNAKGIVFFVHGQKSLLEDFSKKSIEWMKKFFFFFSLLRKKKKQLWDRMNEWPLNFSRKKKHKQFGEKTSFWSFCKISCQIGTHIEKYTRETRKNYEKMAFHLFLSVCFFFFTVAWKKKKQHFGFWMNEWPTIFSAEKKKNGTFDYMKGESHTTLGASSNLLI